MRKLLLCFDSVTKDQGKSDSSAVLKANSANTYPKKSGNKNKNGHSLTPAPFADMKSKSKCHRCHKFGHWRTDHTQDGSLKPGIKSFDYPAEGDVGSSAQPKKTIRFNMVQLVNDEKALDETVIGPLLDDGAPYSGMGLSEFKILQEILLPTWNGEFDPVPADLGTHWQYGNGEHSSESRKILGSVFLNVRTDKGNNTSIRHLIIYGSSQWVVGRNVTRKCDIEHIDQNRVVLPDQSDWISLVDHEMHSYVPYSKFSVDEHSNSLEETTKIFCATAHLSDDDLPRPWPEVKKIVNKVHKHVCGHSTYSDIKTLLERNKLWNEEVQNYLTHILEACTACSTTSKPKPTRKVSLSALTRDFNNVVCIDHFHLGDSRVLHIMDSVSRYSVGEVVDNTSMIQAIPLFESLCITPFRVPEDVLFDPAFDNTDFKDCLTSHGINARPIPPRRHNKNVLESKHKIFRDVYLRLKAENEPATKEHDRLLVQQAIRITNDLYGTDFCSANELAKGYTRPIRAGDLPVVLPTESLDTHDELLAKRKLNRILRSKTIQDKPIQVGDNVQIFIRQQSEKRGKWYSSKTVLAYDKDSGTVTVPGKNGRHVRAAVEDVRMAPSDNTLASSIQEGIDVLTNSLDACIDELNGDETDATAKDTADNTITIRNTDAVRDPQEDTEFDEDGERLTSLSAIGDHIDVYWPLDNQFYSGTVASINDEDETYSIDYKDGEKASFNLPDEVWRYSPNETIAASTAQLEIKDLVSSEQEVLKSYISEFGHKDFMRHQAQGLPCFPLLNAYENEESSFKKTVQAIHVSMIPENATVITSHVIYKVKRKDDGSLKMKARIAPYGNKDSQKFDLKTDSSVCPPTGIRILLSLAVIFQWCLAKIDFKSAFLQTGDAQRDVYVIPPRESGDRQHYWLLLTAAYGLVNANAKWQQHSDYLLKSIGMKQLVYVPQLFYKRGVGGDLQVVAVEIVDDVLFTVKNAIEQLIANIQSNYELGTVVYGPATFLFYGLQICQDTDYSITLQGDEKINGLEGFPISRQRRKEGDTALNPVEMSSFRSVNSSIGWLGIAASPFCAFYASYLQQKVPGTKVSDLICKLNSLRLLKKLGSTMLYKRPNDKKDYKISILIFADADDHGQLGMIAGLPIGDFKAGLVFHTLNWSSQKSKRSVKSIGDAEILAAGETIDEGKVLANAYRELLHMEIELLVALDSKDLFETLSTCRNSIDRSIRADVSVIRYEFETQKVNRMSWIPGKVNLADPVTKPNSPLVEALQLSFFTGELSTSFQDALTGCSNQFTS